MDGFHVLTWPKMTVRILVNVPRRLRTFAAVGLLLFVGHVAAILFAPATGAASLLSNLAQWASAMLAAVACLLAARRSGPNAVRFWTLLALSFALWAFAQLLWTYCQGILGMQLPVLSFAHLLFFFSFAPMALALLDPSPVESGVDWLRLFDGFQIALVVVTTYFYLLSVPALWPSQQSIAQTFAYSMHVRNIMLTIAFGVQSLLAREPRARRMPSHLAMAFFLYTSLNALAAYSLIWLRLSNAGWVDLAWSLPFIAFALVAAEWPQGADIAAPALSARETSVWKLLAINLMPLTIPLLVLYMSSRIAMADLAAAALAVFLSFLCYGLRMVVIHMRQNQALARLRRTEDRFQHLFARHPNPMWVADANDYRFLEVNEAALRKYGYTRERFLRMTALDIRPPEDIPKFIAIFNTFDSSTHLTTYRHRTSDGQIMHVEISAQRLDFAGRNAVLVSVTDVSERLRLEEQLRHSQKLEAVGTLAGGVAHDFNNLLTVIKGYSSILLESVPGGSEHFQQVAEIDRAADRASSLTKQLLAFSRRQILRSESIDLNTIVHSVCRMLERLLGEDIHIHTALAPDLGRTKADPSQLDQVLINLAINARDAMPRGGVLSFKTSNLTFGDHRPPELVDLKPGAYVRLQVADTGTGMDPATLSHIFEPFFTTKDPGQGTGLGLSTVYGIVKQSGGHVMAESTPGHGAKISIYLPRDLAASASPSLEQPSRMLPPSTGHTILLVEDDPGVRRLASEMLESQGFRVLAAANGNEAIKLCREFSGEIHLLLTDVVMPGLNGHELARAIQQFRPRLQTLYMTGYAEETMVRHGLGKPEARLLHKPFTPHALIQSVSQTLEQRPSIGMAEPAF